MRAKVMRAVDEIVTRRVDDQTAALRAEIAALRTDLTDVVGRSQDAVVAELRAAERRSRRDLVAAGERAAVVSTSRFVEEQMRDAIALPDAAATLDHAIAKAPSGGLALEFGVYTGGTLTRIADARAGDPGAVAGFDSFDGLPETWRAGFREGVFDDVTAPPDVPGAEIVVGLFADTLPGFLDAHPGPVDLLHLDADLYSSTATVLDLVGPRLRPGSVVLFDEFFNYPGWEQHEARAWREYVDVSGCTFAWEAYTVADEQVVVRVTG
ncbi:class I SAM-dependent methyltransferase [Pseudonocardia sulfidoxydans]|uniref:class I SAM-dependent methyltransferase n=1 Tax=Pseudonocardia sulfidoxydans TaxID=54011 RepID=UPI0011BE56C1|nr:class I SAM-dependent methyltransferase [Pseudonocardia sulfidoxydans]